MKIKHKRHLRRKGFSLVELLVVIAIIAGLAAVSYGPIIKQMKAAKQQNAIASARNIYTAMLDYAKKKDGLFPSDATAKTSEDGTTPEGCFTMLINAGLVDTEETFWNAENSVIGTTAAAKPDENGTVDPGECAWGYVSGLSTSSRTNLPLFFDSSNQAGIFDTAVWEGYAIIAKLDSSVEAVEITFDGTPFDDNGESKTGPIEEKRGNSTVNLFEDGLPDSAEVLVPSGS